MNYLFDFLISVLASLLAALILFITATRRSKTIRRALTAVASTFLHIDVKYVFTNTKEAEEEIKQALAKTSFVRIFTSRGNQFQRDAYIHLFQENKSIKPFVQILLPEYNGPPGTQWIDQRESEMAKIDKAFGRGILRQQVKSNVEFLRPHIQAGHLEIRQYNAPHIGRIILTEEFLFLQPYKTSSHGRDCPVTQYGRGDMYDMFSRFFDMLWEEAKSHAVVAQSS